MVKQRVLLQKQLWISAAICLAFIWLGSSPVLGQGILPPAPNDDAHSGIDSTVWPDPQTGLIWHKQGCRSFRQNFGGPDGLTLFFARRWISLLNNRQAGGYSDWRLPAINEYRTIFQAGAGQLVYDYRNVEQIPLYTLGYRPPIDGKRRYAWAREVDHDDALAFDFVTGEAKKYPQTLDITYEFEALAVRGSMVAGHGAEK